MNPILNLQLDNWCKLDKAKMTMMDAIFELDKIVDESDPDVRVITPQGTHHSVGVFFPSCVHCPWLFTVNTRLYSIAAS